MCKERTPSRSDENKNPYRETIGIKPVSLCKDADANAILNPFCLDNGGDSGKAY